MSPKDAIRVMSRASKLFGGPLAKAIDGLLKGGKGGIKSLLAADVANLPPDLVGTVVSGLLERLDENEVLETVDKLLGPVLVQRDGDKGTRALRFEVDFHGEVLHLFKVLAAAIEVNYGDFFAASSGLAGAAAGRGTIPA